jgi:hypothetical protein
MHSPYIRSHEGQASALRSPSVADACCGLCGTGMAANHRHLFDSKRAKVVCSCRICSLLCREGIASNNRYRIVPQKRSRIAGFKFEALLWRSLETPVRVAYFVYSSSMGKMVACYPCPVGSVESPLKMDVWRDIEQANPILISLFPDVQALLVNGTEAASEGWIVGIDVCHRLTTTLQSSWGQRDAKNGMQQSLKQFFETLGDDALCY